MRESLPRTRRRLRGTHLLLPLWLFAWGCEMRDPIERAQELQSSGEFEASTQLLREVLAERPDDPQANYLYGRALVATGHLTPASWPLRQAMEHPDWLEIAGIQLAQASLATGDFNEVVEVTSDILEAQPEHTDALLLRAQAYAHWKRDPELALADAERVLESAPDRIEAYEPLILALLGLDRHDEATEALARAGERLEALGAPANRLAWHCSTTAIFAADANDLEGARSHWDACLEAHPADTFVVGNAVQFFDATGDFARSLAILRTAFEQAPNARGYRKALADRLRHAGQVAEGEALLRVATESSDPRLAATAWVDLAKFRHALREHGAAADAMERAVELAEELGDLSPQLLFEYADALVISGQLPQALAVSEDISVPAQRQLIRGRVAQERGDHAAALAAFDEALRLWPNNAFARYYAALAAERVGDFDRALEEYRYSLRIDVGATDARTRAARLLLAERQPVLAYQLLFLEAGPAPLEPEGELLSMYLMALMANPGQLQESLIGVAARSPQRFPAALARGAEGAAERAGPKAALDLLRGAPGLDYTQPLAAPALRALVRFAHAAGRPEQARSRVDAALARHPELGVFHEIRGLHLELAGQGAEAANAYTRALELGPESAAALAGLGRLARERDPDKALAWFDRAAGADPSDSEAALAAARILRAQGQLDEAQRRLAALLAVVPYDAEVAAEAVSIDLERGAISARTADRAQRAARFGGGAEAFDRLSEVYRALGRAEDAEATAARADLLRERQRSGAPGAKVPVGGATATPGNENAQILPKPSL